MIEISMKNLARLELRAFDPMSPSRGGVDLASMEKIGEKFPDGMVGRYWTSPASDHDDYRFKEVLDYVQSIGIVIPPDESALRSGVNYRIFSEAAKMHRENSAFVEARLVGAIPAEIGFDANSMPFVVSDTRLKKGLKFETGGAFAFPEFILVRGEARTRILESELAGLTFIKTKVGKNRLIKDPEELSEEWPDGIEPLYLMTSNVELPVCKNWMFDDAGRVFHPRDRDFESNMYYPLNGRENMGPLHYAEEDIAAYLNFDVVKTYEHYIRNHPKLLVSKRFRDVFKSLGIKGMKYDLGFYSVIDESPWELGTEGTLHPRYSGPPPNSPVD